MDIKKLLASDMDGTVVPLDHKPERQIEIQEFNQLISTHPQVALAYVTGRHLELGLEGVAKHNLPTPRIFVCDVGTTIYLRENGAWQVDRDYRGLLQQSWHNLTGSDIAALLADIPNLEPQEDERQKEFKQSYYVPLLIDRKEIVQQIKTKLHTEDIEANVIYSIDSLKNIGLVDVLPVIAAKDYALQYLWKKLQINKENIVYAGDSGNDLLAFVSGFNAIVVQNTGEDVKEAVRKQIVIKNIEQHLFFANYKYVKGVIEGCFHFKLFKR